MRMLGTLFAFVILWVAVALIVLALAGGAALL
jgi:hypothetical protein